jgi:CO dehydrogenase/acetyl-CoA synthase alpha subunit
MMNVVGVCITAGRIVAVAVVVACMDMSMDTEDAS